METKKTKKALAWIKEHKKEILITTITGIGVGVLGYFGVKSKNKYPSTIIDQLNDVDASQHWLENPVAKLDHVTITDLWDNGNFTEGIINDFTAADMGKVGEELMANIPEVKADTVLSAVFNTTTLTKTAE